LILRHYYTCNIRKNSQKETILTIIVIIESLEGYGVKSLKRFALASSVQVRVYMCKIGKNGKGKKSNHKQCKTVKRYCPERPGASAES
jgi:hypothetical protein